MNYARVGSFTLPDMITQDPVTLAVIMKLMGDVFITSCVHNWGYGHFEYIGCSEHFDVIQEGEKAPAYDIIASNGEAYFVRKEQS